MVSRREDVSKIVQEMLEDYSIEEIAVKIGVSASTIHYWSKGTRKPPMLAVKALRKLHSKMQGDRYDAERNDTRLS
jgi:transposase-like protein